MENRSILLPVWNTVKSKKLAAVMIFLLAVVSTAGMVNPASGIFQTWWFALLGLIFFINLTSCTIQQVINSYRLWSRRNALIRDENSAGLTALCDKPVPEKVVQAMKSRKYRYASGVPGASLWVRGKYGVWGAAVFHTGLIIITVGAMVSGAMKMEGLMVVAEGEVRYELHDYYRGIKEGPFFDEARHRGFGLTLLKQNVILDDHGNVDYIVSDIGILEDGEIVRKVSLEEKEPFIYRGIRIFRREPGFAPFFDITGPDNKPVARTYILLDTHRHTNRTEFYLNGFPVPGSLYTLNIKFFPDMVRRDGEITTNKYTLSNPTAVVYVIKDGKMVSENIIQPGETAEFDGYRLKMGDIRHWNGFDIVNDPGAEYVFAGSWVALAGLAAMYLMPFKKVQVCTGPAGIKVFGITNRYRKTFEEELDEIEKALAGDTAGKGVEEA